MIKPVKSLDGAGFLQEDLLMMKDSEAGVAGEAVVVTSGRLTKAGATVKPDYILAMDTAAGTNVKTLYYPVRDDVTYEADITGTGTVTAGLTTGTLDTAGTGLAAGTQTGGVIKVLWSDNTKKKAHIRF